MSAYYLGLVFLRLWHSVSTRVIFSLMCVYFVSPAAEYQLLCGNQAPGFIIDIHTGKPIGESPETSHVSNTSSFIPTARLYPPQISTSAARSRESARTASASTRSAVSAASVPWASATTTSCSSAKVPTRDCLCTEERCRSSWLTLSVCSPQISTSATAATICASETPTASTSPAATAASVWPDSSCRPAEPVSVSPAPAILN